MPLSIERLLKALGDRTRLRLVNLIGDDEVCVCLFVEALKLSQPKISRHLAYLRRAGVVSARREGQWMHYRLAAPRDPQAAAIFAAVRSTLAEDPVMQSDKRRLVKVCCSPALTAPLKRVPKPASVAAEPA
jgi:ArsR family transcriptional regulator